MPLINLGYRRVIVGLAAAVVVATTVAIGAVAGGTESSAPLLTAKAQRETQDFAQSLSEAGLLVESAKPVVVSGVPAYRVEIAASTWAEHVTRLDDVLRQAALAKAAGVLSLDHVDAAVAAPGAPEKGVPSTAAADSSFLVRINDVQPGTWGAADDARLSEMRAGAVKDVAEAASQARVDLLSVDLVRKKETQVLRVTLVADSSADSRSLTEFRDLLWGRVVPEMNQGPGGIGLAYLEIKAPDGKQLVFEVSDFVIGWANVHSEIDYPVVD